MFIQITQHVGSKIIINCDRIESIALNIDNRHRLRMVGIDESIWIDDKELKKLTNVLDIMHLE